jgi:hypothetical protein
MNIGSYLAVSHVVGDEDCVIVAYQKYSLSCGLGRIIEKVLTNDIRVDRGLDNQEKEAYMVREIRAALERGVNVVMFVDAHAGAAKIMRSLNKAVLSQFPETQKVFVHLREPIVDAGGRPVFSCQVYPATLDLSTICNIRKMTMRKP